MNKKDYAYNYCMDPKHLTAVIVSAILGVILLVTVVAPIVSDGQTTTGDPITITNDSAIVLREVSDGDVLKCTRTKTGASSWTDVWTLNDEVISSLSGGSLSWNVGIMSDAIYMQINSSGNSAAGTYYDMTRSTPSAIYYGISTTAEIGDTGVTSFSFADGVATVTYNENTTLEVPYTWGYVVCPYEDGEYCAPMIGGVGAVKDPNQVTLCGAYTSGDLDTMYYYKDGQTYVSNTDYTMTANITTAVHTGTTDIYDATVSVDMADGTDTETFTPYRILVPYEVTGHATSGSLYSMLGVIPIVVAIGIVLGVVSMAIVNRYD